MGEGIKWYILGSVITALTMSFWINYYDISGDKLKDECEKDLARNLKCEMVYVKPEGV